MLSPVPNPCCLAAPPRLSTAAPEAASVSVVNTLGALAALLVLSDAIPLPGPVSAVKWQRGQAVALAGPPGEPVLLVLSETRGIRRIDAGRAAAGARRADVIDFAMDSEGTVYALLLAAFPLGRDRRFLCRFPEQGDSSCDGLGEHRCRLLAADAPGQAWCLGEGPEGMWLRRLAGSPRVRPIWLPADGTLSAASAAGRVWMEAGSPGMIRIVWPGLALLADVDLAGGKARTSRLPPPAGLSGLETFAAHGERLLALLPLGGSAQAALNEPYGLFELRGAWRRIAPERRWTRGARLAGAEGGAAWIWNRLERRLERVPLPPP